MTEKLTGKVQTVLGPIEPQELGITLPHEHLLIDGSAYFVEPDGATEQRLAHQAVMLENLWWIRYNQVSNLDNLVLSDEELAIREALLFKQAGGNTIVDCTPITAGRNPTGLVRIARATGLNIIIGTAYYVEPTHPAGLDHKTEKEIADEFVRDLTLSVGDSGVCAGIIGEIGCSWPWTESEQKVMRAAVLAQQRTGAALQIHPGRHEMAPLEIIDMLRDTGADLSRTIMCHIERTVYESANRLKIVEAGCYVEYDEFGFEGYYPLTPPMFHDQSPNLAAINLPNDAQRVRQIAELIAEGYVKQVLLSHDIFQKIHLTRFGGYGYGHILRNVVPLMRRKGVSEEHIHTMLVENPKRVLQFAEVGTQPQEGKV